MPPQDGINLSHRIFFNIYVFYLFFFGLHWVFTAEHALLSSCGVQAPGCMGSVVCGMQSLSLRRTSSVVVARGLSCPAACGILVPQPGIQRVTPTLEGGVFITGPPGKSLPHNSKWNSDLWKCKGHFFPAVENHLCLVLNFKTYTCPACTHTNTHTDAYRYTKGKVWGEGQRMWIIITQRKDPERIPHLHGPYCSLKRKERNSSIQQRFLCT